MDFYKQCKMQKQSETGLMTQVAFIPEKFAVKGKFVKLIDEDGWKVTEAAGKKVSLAYLTQKHKSDKNQRWASDIPKGFFKKD